MFMWSLGALHVPQPEPGRFFGVTGQEQAEDWAEPASDTVPKLSKVAVRSFRMMVFGEGCR